MSSAEFGERPDSFFEKIVSPFTRTVSDPGAPVRNRIGTPSSRSISFLRLTASALMSAQKKQRLISTVICPLSSVTEFLDRHQRRAGVKQPLGHLPALRLIYGSDRVRYQKYFPAALHEAGSGAVYAVFGE